MLRTARPALLAVATALAIGGCTSAVSGTPSADPAPPPTAGIGSDPVAFADRMCGAVLTVATPVHAAPDFRGMSQPRTLHRSLSDYLGTLVTAAQQSRAQLAEVGPAPVSGGDAVVRRTDTDLGSLEQALTSLKATIDSADPDDPAALVNAIGEAEELINKVGGPNVLADLASLPLVDRAVTRAAACQKLTELAGQPAGEETSAPPPAEPTTTPNPPEPTPDQSAPVHEPPNPPPAAAPGDSVPGDRQAPG